MKILAVGMNYAAHNKEMAHAETPEDPVIFTKPDSAIIQPNKPFFVPDWAERFDYETEIVVKISRIGRDISERFAHRYYEQLTVGIDFTARDLQEKLRAKALPWDICKGFDNAAAVGKFVNKSEIAPVRYGGDGILDVDVQGIDFHLDKNGQTVQSGNTSDMIHTIDKIVAYASRFFTLKTGDLIYTGTPMGVGPVKEGDVLEGYIGSQKLLTVRIK